MSYTTTNLHFAAFPLFPTDAKLHRDGGRSRRERVGDGAWVISAEAKERKEIAALRNPHSFTVFKSTKKLGGFIKIRKNEDGHVPSLVSSRKEPLKPFGRDLFLETKFRAEFVCLKWWSSI